MKNKIKLGYKKDLGFIFLTKHSFDCGHYWGFGYLGNGSNHFHIDKYLDYDLNLFLDKTKLKKDDWDYVRNKFKEAYKLDKYGLNKNSLESKNIETILDDIWSFLNEKINK